tara:strand:- start:708 stop:1040 length:333 start_codon:yes stop_codon:yes gene_type:complete
MKKMGSIEFFEDIDFNIKFNFNDLMDDFEKTTQNIKEEFIDESDMLKWDLIEKYAIEYINRRIRKEFGEDFQLDVSDDTIDISWDINVKSLKQIKKESVKLKLPKLKNDY